MLTSKQMRLRRSRATRLKIMNSGKYRLLVHRSNKHIYAQIFDPIASKVIACASTVEAEVKAKYPNGSTIEAAKFVGELVAKKSLEHNISDVAFDRSGFKYHGRVKALAESARSAGIKF